MAFDLVVDASAIVSLALMEPDSDRVAEAMLRFGRPCVPAPAYLEAHMVLMGRTVQDPDIRIKTVLEPVGAEVLPFNVEMLELAKGAFQIYGKGRHPAKLNFGDCMVYAVAKALGAPVLCTGYDFQQTDLTLA